MFAIFTIMHTSRRVCSTYDTFDQAVTAARETYNILQLDVDESVPYQAADFVTKNTLDIYSIAPVEMV